MAPRLSLSVRRAQLYAIHIAGQAIGAGTVAVAVAGAGAVARDALGPTVVAAVVCCLVVAYGVGDTLRIPLPRPQPRRQVPERFSRTPYRRTTAFLWGLDLGAGWTTRQPTAALLIVTLGMLAFAWPVPLIVGLAFGVTRGLTVLVGAGASSARVVEERLSVVVAHSVLPRIGAPLSSGLVVLSVIHSI